MNGSYMYVANVITACTAIQHAGPTCQW